MKKLLSLLSVLTISGTAMPNVIAASSYQKEKTKIENNKINNLQINNLEKLNRNKRDIKYNEETISTSDFLEFNNKSINKIFGIDGYVYKIIINSKNNAYFFGNKKSYILKYGETTPIKIKGINDKDTFGKYNPVFIDSKDNIYFESHGGIYKLSVDLDISTKIIGIDCPISTISFESKDNVYIGCLFQKGVFVLKQSETTATKIKDINDEISEIIIDSKDNVYFRTKNGIYVLRNNLNFQSIFIKNNNLEKINNNQDETILNRINYLNRENNYFLNLNKMKVINKTSTSATIETIKGKYRGQVTVNYKNKDKISTVDLNDLLQKAIYFDFIDKNFYYIDKIKEINSNNLNFWNIEITRDSKLLHSIDFKDACFKKKKFTNISSKDTQKRKVPKCDL